MSTAKGILLTIALIAVSVLMYLLMRKSSKVNDLYDHLAEEKAYIAAQKAKQKKEKKLQEYYDARSKYLELIGAEDSGVGIVAEFISFEPDDSSSADQLEDLIDSWAGKDDSGTKVH